MTVVRRFWLSLLFLTLLAEPVVVRAEDHRGLGAVRDARVEPAESAAEMTKSQAAEQLQLQEHQRILGLIPDFNTSYVPDAQPLSAGQKLQLAWKSSLDPFSFAASGLDAGLSSWQHEFPEYGRGRHGYQKRFAASYADSLHGTLLGEPQS